MNQPSQLFERANSLCEICHSDQDLDAFALSPREDSILACGVCRRHLSGEEHAEANSFRPLTDTMWSEYPAVQVASWRILHSLKSDPWAGNLLEQLYLDDELLDWAQAGLAKTAHDPSQVTKDCNGNVLSDGDSVILIKDLNVKGAGFTAKRGTLVKKISLTDNPEHVEGRVEGIFIVLVANFLKKA